MRTTDIPKNDLLVAQLTEIIHADETRALELITEPKPRTIMSGPCVGGTILKNTTTDERTLIAFHLNDEYFMAHNPLDWETIPLTAIVRIQEGRTVIYLNTLARVFGLDDTTEALINGMVAHELGHYLAGHFDQPRESLFQGEATVLTEQLLAGSTLGQEQALEATLYGAALVGVAPMIAMLAYQSAHTTGRGLRMWFSNCLYAFLDQVKQESGILLEADHQIDSLQVLSDEQVAEIKNAAEPA